MSLEVKSDPKSKAQTKAERRALQEAQRAAKAKDSASISVNKSLKLPSKTNNDASKKNQAIKENQETKESKNSQSSAEQTIRKIHLFEHLNSNYELDFITDFGGSKNTSNGKIHQEFEKLACRIKTGEVRGSTERCIAFIEAIKILVNAHQLSDYEEDELTILRTNRFAGTFVKKFSQHALFIHSIRPLSITTRSFIQFLTVQLGKMDPTANWEDSRIVICECIENFAREQIEIAECAIKSLAAEYIYPGETLCTFGYSTLIFKVILHAWEKAKSDPNLIFSVLVVDSGPQFEGRKMLKKLNEEKVPCEYSMLTGVPSISSRISLILLGAHSLLNNGNVLTRIGSAQLVVSVPHAPVIVCAETYKFWDRAQSDAYEYNEFASNDFRLLKPEITLSEYCFPASRKETTYEPDLINSIFPSLHLLNLEYDILPSSLVTAVITEVGTLPTTSVPVILRVKQTSGASIM